MEDKNEVYVKEDGGKVLRLFQEVEAMSHFHKVWFTQDQHQWFSMEDGTVTILPSAPRVPVKEQYQMTKTSRMILVNNGTRFSGTMMQYGWSAYTVDPDGNVKYYFRNISTKQLQVDLRKIFKMFSSGLRPEENALLLEEMRAAYDQEATTLKSNRKIPVTRSSTYMQMLKLERRN